MAFPCTHKFYVQILLQVISSSLHKLLIIYTLISFFQVSEKSLKSSNKLSPKRYMSFTSYKMEIQWRADKFSELSL